MLLVPSIMLKRTKTNPFPFFFFLFTILAGSGLSAQDNSPYSRYGLGDLVPNTNIVNRAMGGISAGYSDFLSINFNNPASYSGFQTLVEPRSNKSISGRVLLDVGLNFETRSLRSPNQLEKFTSSNALFSYLHVGVPLKKNWGLSFGIKPVSRISYKIQQNQLITDPVTGDKIDSAFTEYTGDGGTYLPSVGTGFRIKDLSVGFNVGYLFGKREATRRRALRNDSVLYTDSRQTTLSSFGDIFLNAGAQYTVDLSKATKLRLGVSGNLKQNLKGKEDFSAETFRRDVDGSDITIDSVFEKIDIKGEVVYPASYTFGFVAEHAKEKGQGWSLGADFVTTQWDEYRFFGKGDAVQNNWQVRFGGQYRPQTKNNYFSNVSYRAGFYSGKDYITAGGELPQWGASLGLGLPIANYNRLSLNQYTIINLALEYDKRGNDENLLKENMFRVSIGLNLSDLWFTKRKYD
jgi:hypothetical protein